MRNLFIIIFTVAVFTLVNNIITTGQTAEAVNSIADQCTEAIQYCD